MKVVGLSASKTNIGGNDIACGTKCPGGDIPGGNIWEKTARLPKSIGRIAYACYIVCTGAGWTAGCIINIGVTLLH